MFIRSPLTTAEVVVDITSDLARAVHGEVATARAALGASYPASVDPYPCAVGTDPFGRFELRYWDGTRWTEHVASQGVQSVDQR